jgi:hypothetical protein
VTRGYDRAEKATAVRDEREMHRASMARKGRASARASGSEAEFVRRARDTGLLVRPRYAKNTTDVVVGYSVAERPPRGERPIWFGGGTLASDLKLGALRQEWTDSPQSATGGWVDRGTLKAQPTERQLPQRLYSEDQARGGYCQFQKSSALDPAEVRGECRGLLTSGCQKSRARSSKSSEVPCTVTVG